MSNKKVTKDNKLNETKTEDPKVEVVSKENNQIPSNKMINISYKKLAKRVLAYMIDIVIVTIIATLLSYIPILNKEFNKYQTISNEFEEIYNEYTNTTVLLNDAYKDKKVTQEEYEELIKNERYSQIISEKYSDEKISKDEYEQIKNEIQTIYNEIAKEYNYKLNRTGIYNSIITLICTLLYFGVFQYFLKGETIGKKIMGLKIVSANNKKITILNYLLRSLIVNNVFLNAINIIFLAFAKESLFNQVDYIIGLLVSIIEAIIIFLVITREDNRGLHDLLCNTKVISIKED